MRYKLMPTIIAAGHQATETAFPLVARLDLFWPLNESAADNTSYLFLNDTLVAPIFDMESLTSAREVWIPEGDWEDAWSGDVVTGPKTVSNEQPYNRIPMYHRRGESG
jgi:alpha-glucosidase (family GH31 glycosyl hydrolase)